MKCDPTARTFEATHYELELADWLDQISNQDILVRVSEIFPQRPLHPAEAKFVTKAVSARQAEFAAGRYCGRQLLAECGYAMVPILVGSKGEPLWPESIIGSISHDRNLAAAVISQNPKLGGLGIDMLGIDHQLDQANADLIAGDVEVGNFTEILCRQASRSSLVMHLDPLLLIFSIKESAIKAVSPFLDYYLDFREIELILSGASVTARFQNLSLDLDVYWKVIGGVVFSFAVIKRAQLPNFALNYRYVENQM